MPYPGAAGFSGNLQSDRGVQLHTIAAMGPVHVTTQTTDVDLRWNCPFAVLALKRRHGRQGSAPDPQDYVAISRFVDSARDADLGLS